MGEDEEEDPEENPEEDPEEGETMKVARIWFKSLQARKEASSFLLGYCLLYFISISFLSNIIIFWRRSEWSSHSSCTCCEPVRLPLSSIFVCSRIVLLVYIISFNFPFP